MKRTSDGRDHRRRSAEGLAAEVCKRLAVAGALDAAATLRGLAQRLVNLHSWKRRYAETSRSLERLRSATQHLLEQDASTLRGAGPGEPAVVGSARAMLADLDDELRARLQAWDDAVRAAIPGLAHGKVMAWRAVQDLPFPGKPAIAAYFAYDAHYMGLGAADIAKIEALVVVGYFPGLVVPKGAKTYLDDSEHATRRWAAVLKKVNVIHDGG